MNKEDEPQYMDFGFGENDKRLVPIYDPDDEDCDLDVFLPPSGVIGMGSVPDPRQVTVETLAQTASEMGLRVYITAPAQYESEPFWVTLVSPHFRIPSTCSFNLSLSFVDEEHRDYGSYWEVGYSPLKAPPPDHKKYLNSRLGRGEVLRHTTKTVQSIESGYYSEDISIPDPYRGWVDYKGVGRLYIMEAHCGMWEDVLTRAVKDLAKKAWGIENV